MHRLRADCRWLAGIELASGTASALCASIVETADESRSGAQLIVASGLTGWLRFSYGARQHSRKYSTPNTLTPSAGRAHSPSLSLSLYVSGIRADCPRVALRNAASGTNEYGEYPYKHLTSTLTTLPAIRHLAALRCAALRCTSGRTDALHSRSGSPPDTWQA